MAALLALPWIAVVLPIALAPVIALAARRARIIGPLVAVIGPLLVLAVGVLSLVEIGAFSGAEAEAATQAPWTSALASSGSMPWFSIGDTSLRLGWGIDGLAALMLVIVGFVATCVVVFSAGYMKGDQGWARYFGLLSLFTGSMTLLVIGDSFLTLFVGWELVGACSYLLIGFWFTKPSAAAAATKAFMTTRIGDVAMLLGIGVLWAGTGTLVYTELLERIGGIPFALMTAAMALIALGAIGKSAQFPLHAWLPDAMEGPTPVSALIHAATMVAAGVFLIARVWPLFEGVPGAQMVVLTAGAVSALGASLAALAQRDIKKVLAYSTISQLGFMFCALGVGAWFAAFFHLATHAAFKALLFLASGSVIHGSGTQDMRAMGGLRKSMPVTFAVWLVGVTALMGLPVFSGFFSKDLVLEQVFHAAPALGIALFAASAVTAVYATRATRLTFFGEPEPGLHPHESPFTMLAPLAALAVPAALLGFAEPVFGIALGHEGEPLALAISAVAVGAALIGILIGWSISGGRVADEKLEQRAGRVWAVLAGAYGWDEFVRRTVVGPAVVLSRTLWAVGDRFIADGAVHGAAGLARRASRRITSWQTGDAQAYAAAVAVGLALMLAATVWLGRW